MTEAALSTGKTERSRRFISLAGFLGLFCLFGLITVLFFQEWLPTLSSSLIGPPEDNMQDFWNTWYVTTGKNPIDFFYTKLLDFPQGTSLYYHSFAYPKVFAIFLLTKIFGTDIPTLVFLHNLLLLLSFPLAATGAFYLIRHLVKNTAGALAGAYIFAFSPRHIEQIMHHMGVGSIEFIPMFMFAWLLAFERKSYRWLMVAIVFYALSALSCWYYIFYLGYFIIFHMMYVCISEKRRPTSSELAMSISCLAGVMLLLSPLIIPMIDIALRQTTVAYPDYFLDIFVIDLASYVLFPADHFLSALSQSARGMLSGTQWTAAGYLGLINIALLIWVYLFAPGKNRKLLNYTMAGMMVFTALACGNYLHFLGYRIFIMPTYLLSQIPFVDIISTPARAVMMVYLFFAIAVGHAVAIAYDYRQIPYMRVLLGLLLTLMFLDFYPVFAKADSTPVACGPSMDILRENAGQEFGILNLPRGTNAAYIEGNAYMMEQACHEHPIVSGNTARDVAFTLFDYLETRNIGLQKNILAASKVKYIVIHHPSGQFFHWQKEDGDESTYYKTYKTVYQGSQHTILQVY